PAARRRATADTEGRWPLADGDGEGAGDQPADLARPGGLRSEHDTEHADAGVPCARMRNRAPVRGAGASRGGEITTVALTTGDANLRTARSGRVVRRVVDATGSARTSMDGGLLPMSIENAVPEWFREWRERIALQGEVQRPTTRRVQRRGVVKSA